MLLCSLIFGIEQSLEKRAIDYCKASAKGKSQLIAQSCEQTHQIQFTCLLFNNLPLIKFQQDSHTLYHLHAVEILYWRFCNNAVFEEILACVSVYPSNSWGIEVVLTYFIQYIFELSGIFSPKIHFNYDIPRIMQIIRLSDTNVSQQKDNLEWYWKKKANVKSDC